MLSFDDRLRRLGLSDAEATAFTVILEEGTVTASDVAGATDLSRRYVYSVAESLEERGFVTVNEFASPTTIEVRPPAAIFSTLTEDFEALRAGVESRYHEAAVPANQFQIVALRSRMLSWLRTRIEEAQREVVLMGPPPLFSDLLDDLSAAIDRGVLVVLLLTSESVEGDRNAFRPASSVARVWPAETEIYFAGDGRHALVAPGVMGWREATGERAVAFNDQQKVAPIVDGSMLGNYWPMGEERHVTDPIELPATFTHFRRAVIHAAIHRRNDTEIDVAAEARPANSGESPERLTGRLLDVNQGLIEPHTAAFPIQCSLEVRTDEGVVTLGGPAAFLEAYEVLGEIRLTESD